MSTASLSFGFKRHVIGVPEEEKREGSIEKNI